MPSSKTQSFRLGTRTDTQINRLADRLDLSRSDVLRLALYHLESGDPAATAAAYAAAHAAARDAARMAFDSAIST